MKKAEFVCEEHKEYGGLGFRLLSQPGFDPLGASAVAHDLIEHFPNGDESIADEFMALGACLAIRGEGGFFHIQAGEAISGDLAELIQKAECGMEVKPAPKTKPLNGDYERMEQQITVAVRQAKKELENEREIKLRPEWETAMRSWIRIGFRKALKRFPGLLMNCVQEVFRKIESQAEKCLKNAEEGMILRVSYNIKRCNVNVSCDYDWALDN